MKRSHFLRSGKALCGGGVFEGWGSGRVEEKEIKRVSDSEQKIKTFLTLNRWKPAYLRSILCDLCGWQLWDWLLERTHPYRTDSRR